MNDFTFTGQGFSDYLYWQTQDRKTLKKINAAPRIVGINPGETENSVMKYGALAARR